MATGGPEVLRTGKEKLVARLLDSRRRVGTVGAIAIAGLLAYHVVAGNNGLTVYNQKRAEDRVLAAKVQEMQRENDRLKKHVDHLASDPDAIEFEAHSRLRYTKRDQVIVLNDDSGSSQR